MDGPSILSDGFGTRWTLGPLACGVPIRGGGGGGIHDGTEGALK